MADYSDAADALSTSLNSEPVEEYEISDRGRRVKRGSLADQVKTLATLRGLAARASGGLFRLAKHTEPTDVE